MKKLLLILIIIISILVCIGFVIYKNIELHTLTNNEAVAYTHLRLVEAQLAHDGNITQEFTSEEMKLFENMARRVNSKTDWFSKNNGIFYTKTIDTSEYQIIWISDGIYYATFYVKQNKSHNTYKLEKVTFSTGTEKGYELYIK